MIGIRDTFKFARTKLKTRRIRLAVTVVTMSLLFAGLSFGAFVSEGALHSTESFGKEGYGNFVYVGATPVAYTEFQNQALVDKLKPQHDQLVAQKKQLAKKLDVPYEEKADQTLPLTSQQTGPNATDVQLVPNAASPIAQKALAEQNSTLPGVNYTDFQKLAKNSGAMETFRSATSYSYSGQQSSTRVLKDGKEAYTAAKNPGQNYQPPSGIESIEQMGATQMDAGLLRPFLLQHESTAVGKDGSIPLVAPYSAVEEVLGLSSLPATATAKDKLARLIEVREKIAGKTAAMCYRNAASETLLQKAIAQRDEIAANKGKKDYELPKLLYALPTTPCGATTIKSDKRSSEEKQLVANQTKFDNTFTPAEEPVQGAFPIRIVGIGSDAPDMSTFSAIGILSILLSSHTGQGWFVPSEALQNQPIAASAFGGAPGTQAVGSTTYYAKFDSSTKAKSFMKANSCDLQKIYMTHQNGGPVDVVEPCRTEGKQFTMNPYGNNASVVEDVRAGVWKVGRVVALIMLAISSLVMMGTLGKIIADSRRETAVFRALGAKRLDISQIYLTYALVISLFIALLSITVGAIFAQMLSARLSPALSVNAVLSYNASDPHKQFTLFGVNFTYMLAIVGAIMATALIAACIPLLANMRRNPIRDMRDES